MPIIFIIIEMTKTSKKMRLNKYQQGDNFFLTYKNKNRFYQNSFFLISIINNCIQITEHYIFSVIIGSNRKLSLGIRVKNVIYFFFIYHLNYETNKTKIILVILDQISIVIE